MPRLTPRHGSALVIVFAASLPYLRTIPDYFVQDDFGGMALLAAKPWHTFPRWFTMPWMEFIWGYTPDEIRPFTALSYQISALWSASAPQGHNLVNIALHAANGMIVAAIGRTAAGSTLAGSTIAAVVFVLLPASAESVAWITGRVDSLPAFFYLLSFLAYVEWRRGVRPRTSLYVWSLVWFFLALFSKQNTITMVAALAAFDWIVGRRPVRPTWEWLRPYLPFAALTGGFLWLRYLLLGEVVRESQLSAQRFAEFGGLVARHVQRVVWGDLGPVPDGIRWFAAVYTLAAVVAVARLDAPTRASTLRVALYFGVAWTALGLAPTVAAGYESPRHAYLAAVGWAMLFGLTFDALRRAVVVPGRLPLRGWRATVTAATLVILVLYSVRQHREISDWRLRAAVAETATRELERQVLTAPEGSLFMVFVPVASWEWAAPFVARPPYTSTDLTARADIVVPIRLHCCRGHYWDSETRAALVKNADTGAPIIALYVSSHGEVRRLTDSDEPAMRTIVETFREIRSTGGLDSALQDLLRKLVAGRGRIIVRPLTR